MWKTQVQISSMPKFSTDMNLALLSSCNFLRQTFGKILITCSLFNMLQNNVEIKFPCTQDSVKEMTLLHVRERQDLHAVVKLWQHTERLKISCLSKAIPENWGLKSQVLVQWLFWKICHKTCYKDPLWCPSTPLIHELVVLRVQESSGQIILIDKTFYMYKGKVKFSRLVCSVINVCRIDCTLQRQPHASPSLLHTNEVTPQHNRVHMLWCDLLFGDIYQWNVLW